LLSSEGIKLIDAFQLQAGEVAPGWTPGWSAPEQVLGEPVSIAADVHPFGRMITELLGGKLTGEARKFKTATFDGKEQEFDVLYNPSVRISPDNGIVPRDGVRPWADLARRCLRFEPADRPPNLQAFADELSLLIENFPLQGKSIFTLSQNLVAATFLDGSDGFARLIPIDWASEPVDSSHTWGAQQPPLDPR